MINGINSNNGATALSVLCKTCGISVNSTESDFDTLSSQEAQEEKTLESTSSLSMTKELSEKEKQRLEYLKNMLTQMLSAAENPPSEEQKRNIQRVEKEIEKLTGIKTSKNSITQNMAKLPGKDDDKDKKEKEEEKAGMRNSEFLKEQQMAEINLLEGLNKSEGGTMSQVLRGLAGLCYENAALPTSANSTLKSIKV